MNKFRDLSFGKQLAIAMGGLALVNIAGFIVLFVCLDGKGLIDKIFAAAADNPTYEESASTDPQGSIDKATEKIKRNPRDADAYARRADGYNWKQNYDAALHDYDQAIRLKDSVPDWFVERGNIYEILDKDDLAIADFTKAIELDPETEAGYTERADAYGTLGKNDLALADYEKSLQTSNQADRIYLSRARLWKSMGRMDKAMQDYQWAIQVNGKVYSADALEERAAIYEKDGDMQKALADYGAWIELDPQSTEPFSKRAELYTRLGKKAEAQADLEAAVRVLTEKLGEPESGYDLEERGDFFEKLGKLPEAKEDWKKAIVLYDRQAKTASPTSHEYRTIAQLCKKIGDEKGRLAAHKKQLEVLAAGMKAEPKNTDILHTRGLLYADDKDYEAALADFSAAVAISPDNSDYHRHRAVVLLKLKRFKQSAVEMRKSMIQANPAAAADFEILAEALEMSGQHAEAKAAASQGVKLDSRSGPAYYWRAHAEHSLGETKVAAADFAHAKQLGGLDPEEQNKD